MNAQWVALPVHTGHVVFQTRHRSCESHIAVRSSAMGTALVVKSMLPKGKTEATLSVWYLGTEFVLQAPAL